MILFTYNKIVNEAYNLYITNATDYSNDWFAMYINGKYLMGALDDTPFSSRIEPWYGISHKYSDGINLL